VAPDQPPAPQPAPPLTAGAGVDIARPLVQRAQQRARHDGLTNVGFEHGDAQTHRLAPPGFDVAISRLG
jgi:tRNA/tmRNA/rRNA uracil-C5-methylase (TrmA/RlmC/RlmD family)